MLNTISKATFCGLPGLFHVVGTSAPEIPLTSLSEIRESKKLLYDPETACISTEATKKPVFESNTDTLTLLEKTYYNRSVPIDENEI